MIRGIHTALHVLPSKYALLRPSMDVHLDRLTLLAACRSHYLLYTSPVPLTYLQRLTSSSAVCLKCLVRQKTCVGEKLTITGKDSLKLRLPPVSQVLSVGSFICLVDFKP